MKVPDRVKSTFKLIFYGFIIAALLFLVGALYQYIHNSKNPTTHTNTYKTAMGVVKDETVIRTSPCVPVNVSVTIRPDTVILSVGYDIMSGKPIGIGEQGEIICQTITGRKFALKKLSPDSGGKKHDLLLLIDSHGIIVFSPKGTCEDIETFLSRQR